MNPEENQIVADNTMNPEENQIVADNTMNPEENQIAADNTMNPEEKQIVAVKDIENPKKRKDRRVEIKLIEHKGELNTTFTKRRQGLFKKAMDFCEKFDAELAVITFSRSGNLYVMGDPNFYPFLKRYLADPSSSLAVGGAGAEALLPENPALTDMEKRIDEALGKGRPAWDMIVENLGLSQLEEIEKAVEVMITKITARRD